MADYLTRAQDVFSKIDELASISENENYIARTFGTPAFIEGSRKVAMWMLEAGLDTRIDSIGNVRGKLESPTPDAKTLVIASHIDTVVNAGKFDGPLGVLIGLNLLEHFVAQAIAIPFNIELIAFSDEEGLRFHTTYLGSKVVTGAFDFDLLKRLDKDGISLKDVIKMMGNKPGLISQDAIAPEDWLAYFEIHIEQGPILDERKIPVGLVTGIAGQKRVEITFDGMSGHAGTVPMNMRQDALTAASQFVLEVENFALRNQEKLVATVGKLEIVNAASNVIPGKVVCSLDLRSLDASTLDSASDSLKNVLQEISDKRSIKYHWELIQETPPVTCDNNLNCMLKQAIEESGYDAIELVSGAGHDAVPVSLVSPVCMLFVRCDKGISHNPLENTELEDIAAAIRVSENFLHQLIKINQN